MLCKSTKVMVRSLNVLISFFDVVAGNLQGDILAIYMSIISLDYVK